MEENIINEKKKQNTKEILRGSWRILKKERKLLLLSIVPTLLVVILLLGIFTVLFLFFYSKEISRDFLTPVLIVLFIFFILSYFIICLFRAALIYCVDKFLKNEKVNLKESFFVARKHFVEIAKWTLTDVIFRLGVGSLNRQEMNYITASLSFAAVSTWRLLMIFVVPIIILENLPIKKAMEKSYQLFTKVWKNVTVFDFSLDLIFIIVGIGGVFLIPVFILMFADIIPPFIANHIEILLALAYGLLITIILGFGLVVVTIREIFVVVLYNYVVLGKVPVGFFDEKVIKESFK